MLWPRLTLLIRDFDAFFLGHRRCGDLDGGASRERAWPPRCRSNTSPCWKAAHERISRCRCWSAGLTIPPSLLLRADQV